MKVIEEISSLRFIFMVLIFLHHTIDYNGGGYLGVDFFFILSGFVMTLGYKDKVLGQSFSYKAFIKKRAIKYYPLHWLCLLFVIILDFLRGAISSNSLIPLLFNATLIQSWIPSRSIYFSFNAPSWFLSDTLFFICVFPLLIRFITKLWSSKVKTLVWLLTLIMGYFVLFLTISEESRHYFLYINPVVRLLDFIFGIYSALVFLYLKGKETFVCSFKVPLSFLMYSCIPLLIFLSIILHERLLSCSLVFAPIICALLILVSLQPVGNDSIFSWRPLVRMGEYSFEFYMIHRVCIRYLYYANHVLNISEKALYLPFFFLIISLLSIVCRRWFVLPVTDYLQKSSAR